MELAASWERAASSGRGLPGEIEKLLDQHAMTSGASLLFGIPEHQVPLPGGTRPSQTDLWAVLKTGDGLVSVAVEGKALEPFGPTVDEWLAPPADGKPATSLEGKRARLDYLCDVLGIARLQASPLRYQLFHRAASAVIEARRIGARTAMLLVQSFDEKSQSWPDFDLFVRQFGASAGRVGICETKCPEVERLLFAWVDSPAMTDAEFERFPGADWVATDKAYRDTSFIGDTPAGEIIIRVGKKSEALDAMLAKEGVRDWAFITAWNPRSQKLSEAENAARNDALREALRAKGVKFFEGKGVGPDGGWSEESVLAIGINREDALAIGRRYAQAAIVIGSAEKPAKLLYC